MKNKIKNFNDLKNITVDILLPTMIVFWYFFLYLQLAFALGEKNHEIFFNYAQISLTLFGFTLLGTFFEKKRLSRNGLTDEEKKSIGQLVNINLNFLVTSICFLIIYSGVIMMGFEFENQIAINTLVIVYFSALVVGIVGLSFGTLQLYMFLRSWNKTGL